MSLSFGLFWQVNALITVHRIATKESVQLRKAKF